MKQSASTRTELAWMGWRLRLPGDWRPLRIEGDWDRGSAMVGDLRQAILQVKWWRPGKRFDAQRWRRRRLQTSRGREAPGGPSPSGFSQVIWVPEEQMKRSARRSLWCGYAPRAQLVLQVVINSAVSKEIKKDVISRVLPSLRVTDPDSALRWAVFSASFETPAGFILTEERLTLGDVCLLFSAPDGSRLLLRQIYPSELALLRRDMERWLASSPFKERRRYRPRGHTQAWAVDSFGRRLEGIKRQGRKCFRFPLEGLRPKFSVAAAIHDQELNRLLLAEYDSPGEPAEAGLATALGRMNWAQLDPGRN